MPRIKVELNDGGLVGTVELGGPNKIWGVIIDRKLGELIQVLQEAFEQEEIESYKEP